MKKIIRSIFLILNLLFIVCALITFWSGSFSPDSFVVPAYFALIFPLILFANIGFIIFWMVFRKWYFVLSLALLVFSCSKIATVFPLHFHAEKAQEQEESFSIMTYNTGMMGGIKKHTEKSPNMVIQHILDCDADIVCMQEFYVATNYLTQEDIMKIFKKYPYKHIYYKNQGTRRKSGIATFSKYPMLKKETVDFPSNQNSAIYSDIVIRKDTIRLFNCHLESNLLTEKDKAMPSELRKNFDAENLSNVTIHLSRKLATAYKTRAKQADIISEYIKKSPYKVMLCGDFNDLPLSYSYTKIKGEMLDAFEELGFGLGFTFNQSFYKFRIDYILCDPALTPLQLNRDKVKYSDHYPLRSEIKSADL